MILDSYLNKPRDAGDRPGVFFLPMGWSLFYF